jgi:ADP-ribose diphosphatase
MSRTVVYILPMPKSTRRAHVISSKLRFRGPVFSVFTDVVREPGGIVARRDVIRHSGSVVVLPVDGRGAELRLLLERQYRHAAGKYLWELPAGRKDPHESALAGAKRELLEETGFTARSWKRILHFYVSPGFLDETMTVFLARGLRPGTAQPEADERIAMRFFPLKAALKMITNDRIRDAKTISSVLWLAHKKAPR